MNPPRLTLIPLIGFTFLTSATYSVARALGVSLFIARMGSDALPVALAASAVTVIAVSAITHLVNQRFPARYSVFGSWIGLASITAWLTVMISVEHHSFVLLGALYVTAEVRGCVNTIYATTLVNNAFASSTSKRPFVLVAAGAPIAGIAMGAAMGLNRILRSTHRRKRIETGSVQSDTSRPAQRLFAIDTVWSA